MSTNAIETRLSALESEMAWLREKLLDASRPWWEAIAGTFANDPLHDEAMRLGKAWRDAQKSGAKKKGTNSNGRARHRSRKPTRA